MLVYGARVEKRVGLGLRAINQHQVFLNKTYIRGLNLVKISKLHSTFAHLASAVKYFTFGFISTLLKEECIKYYVDAFNEIKPETEAEYICKTPNVPP